MSTIYYVRKTSADVNGDGIPDQVTTSSYDANDNLIENRVDTDGDGQPNQILTYSYNAAGQVTQERFDNDGDGQLDRINTYIYDANGKLTQERFDLNADGQPDQINLYTYDAAGNRVEEKFDHDGDGRPDRIKTYTYDANGKLTQERFDTNGDGTPNQVNTYRFDDQGNPIEESFDRDGDGKPDEVFTYSYDSTGNRIKESFDFDGDGKPDRRNTFNYDANRNLIESIFDLGADGKPDQIITYSYDTAGNLTKVSLDIDGDGQPNRTITYAYDKNGQRTQESFDTNGDGQPDQIITYTLNFLPQASPDFATTPLGKPIILNVLANDIDRDQGPAPLSISGLTEPTLGSAKIVDNTILYTPNADALLLGMPLFDSFEYTVSDGFGFPVTASVLVTLVDANTNVLYGTVGDNINPPITPESGSGKTVLVGLNGSDVLVGASATDILVGVHPASAQPGLGEIDLLVGGKAPGTVFLGNTKSAFYSDGQPDFDETQASPYRTDSDFALILDFGINPDNSGTIQLHGNTSAYHFETNLKIQLNAKFGAYEGQYVGTGIYYQKEFIGLVVGVDNLKASILTFV